MIYLAKYHRPTQRVVFSQWYAEADREIAQARQAQEEQALGEDRMDYEVLLLESDSEGTLRRTHARYFEPFDPLGELGAASRSSS